MGHGREQESQDPAVGHLLRRTSQEMKVVVECVSKGEILLDINLKNLWDTQM